MEWFAVILFITLLEFWDVEKDDSNQVGWVYFCIKNDLLETKWLIQEALSLLLKWVFPISSWLGGDLQ